MQPVVSICVITYNQEKYISEALNGILSQKVKFDFEIILGEDCSTDSTRTICLEYQKNYPDKFKLLLNEKNIGMMNNFFQTLSAGKGKYIAICEGDDYWIDANKLQKQIDFLENHPQYGMICTDYDVLNQIDNKIDKDYLKNKFDYTKEKDVEFEYYINKRKYIRTLTACFRRDIYDKYVKEIDGNIRCNNAASDLPLWLYFLTSSKVKYIPDTTATYRVSPNTASRTTDLKKRYEFSKTIADVIEYYASRYKLSKRTLKQIKTNRILSRMVYDFFENKTFEIFKSIIRLIMIGSKSKQSIYFLLGSMNKKFKSIAIKKYDMENLFS